MNGCKKIIVTYITNWNVDEKFSKKTLKYKISKGANSFESAPNTDIYLPVVIALKRVIKLSI